MGVVVGVVDAAIAHAGATGAESITMTEVILSLIGVAAGAGGALLLVRGAARKAPETLTITSMAERLRTVGKLVGLEVSAKEIATSTKGWDWTPPILLSPAKVAMIFHFEQQYYVDLSRLAPADVEDVTGPASRMREGPPRRRLRLPAIEHSLKLTELEPYDIQAGRMLGLLDVIPMGASRQRDLMKRAQDEAGRLFRAHDERYRAAARASIERQLISLMAMVGADVEIVWKPEPERCGSGPAAMALPGALAASTRASSPAA